GRIYTTTIRISRVFVLASLRADLGLFVEHSMANYMIARFDDIDAVKCPCGFSRRAFVSPDNTLATMHIVDIEQDAKVHFHKKLTEIYLVLEGDGNMELDGEMVPVKPFTAIFIKPGCRHRAVGRMRIVNVSIPAFDPQDEWFD
ncbi:MAG TPA: cupin domain-containing protein, partial [Sedimentisphaerales bacterium]|nr:cupin domain-containing protein [Sedimentisphaerales bacterium]